MGSWEGRDGGLFDDRRTAAATRWLATAARRQRDADPFVPRATSLSKATVVRRSASEVAAALDDQLYALNAALPTESGEGRFPKDPRAYLEDWSVSDAGYLRRFYPPGDDEVHYEVTPGLREGVRVGVVARGPIVRGHRIEAAHRGRAAAADRARHRGRSRCPSGRAAPPTRRAGRGDRGGGGRPASRCSIATGVRDRYQQFSATARELLSDFREVEENFRRLDRAARERIASWDGSKGELLAELVGSRSEITGSDQGRSFQAFYEFLLSEARQTELADLLARVAALDSVETDRRMRGIHHDWSEAAERAQRTVRQISEQLRRFLDDQVWLENRRVLDLVRAVESAALERPRRSADVRARGRRTRHRDRAAVRATAVPAARDGGGGEPSSRRRQTRSTPTCCSLRPSSTRPA